MKIKKRLDLVLFEQYPKLSRNQIQSFIMQGRALVNGKVVTKAGAQVTSSDTASLNCDEPKYVSRGGFKLEAALTSFKLNVTGMVALDAGISTGGFSDCLLQHGIKKVYGVDVGTGQVHEKIRTNPAVILLEDTNLRYLTTLPEQVDLVTLDLSFISLLKVIPAVSKLLKPSGIIITLIKPQFESDRQDIRRGGIIKDDAVHQKIIEKIKNGMQELGFKMEHLITSPITGAAAGNKEFLALFTRI